jgi:hypothetical protein
MFTTHLFNVHYNNMLPLTHPNVTSGLFHSGFPSRLGGAMDSVLATGPKGCGFKPSRGNGFLRVTKIRTTPSFGWEVKPEVPCCKILWHVKDPLTYEKY